MFPKLIKPKQKLQNPYTILITSKKLKLQFTIIQFTIKQHSKIIQTDQSETTIFFNKAK